MATHRSALKAHRQSLKRRAQNREQRTQLRTALKDIRAALEGKDAAGARTELKQTISLIDKMAGKGIIHINAANRYKSRLMQRLQSASR